MGCYNLACSITNLPIKRGDEAVVYRLVEDNNTSNIIIGSSHSVCGYPERGIMGDYARLEGSDDKTPLLAFHAPVYDLMVQGAKDDRQYWLDVNERLEKDEPDDLIEACKTLVANASLDTSEMHMLWSQTKREIKAIIGTEEGFDHAKCWSEIIIESDDPVKEVERYRNEIECLAFGRFALGFEIRPSRYANGPGEEEPELMRKVHLAALAKLSVWEQDHD